MKKIKSRNNSFNLYRHSLKKYSATGHDVQVYRKQYYWFNLEDILSGKAVEWNELEKANPSLKGFVYEAQSKYNYYMNIFRERYQTSEDMIRKIYRMYVSYHPAYGAYYLSVGPYVGEKIEDQQNKFGYFTRRFASTETKSLLDLVSGNMKTNEGLKKIAEELKLSDISSILSPTDFKVNVKRKKDGDRGTTRERYKTIDINDEYLQRNTYIPTENEVHCPILGSGSEIEIKASGIYKLLKEYVFRKGAEAKENLNKVTISVANQMNIPLNNISREVNTNITFMHAILKQYSNYYPNFKDIWKTRTIGTQREERLKKSSEQVRILELMKEICNVISETNITDVKLLKDELNRHRENRKTIAKGFFNEEILSQWMEQIETLRNRYDDNGNIIGKFSFSEMVEEIDNILNDLETQNGFDNINIALQLASLKFVELPIERIDPVTRANLNIEADVFDLSDEEDIVTSEELTKMREKQGFYDNNEEQIEDEIINDENEIEFTDDIDSIDIEQPSVKDIEEESFEDDNLENTEELSEEEKEIISNTINSLIKISNELKSKRKYNEISDINLIINKYKRFTL